MPGELFLALDVGTSATKAGLIARDGRLVAAWRAAQDTARPQPGRAEQDPGDWVRHARAALRALKKDVAQAQVVAGALCSQVNTHVFVDAAGRALMPAILWQDIRAAAEARELDARVTPAQKRAWWGAEMPVDASHVLARMLWVSRHRPDIWDRTSRVVLPKDLVLFDLTGEWRSDPLSNIGLVGANGAYLPEAAALVPGAAERLVPLAGPADVIGHLRADTGFGGLPMVCATMDAWTALIGAGGGIEGAGSYVSGTSEVLGIQSARIAPAPGAIVFPSALGCRIHAGPTQSGGAAQLWACGVLGVSPEGLADAVAMTPRSEATPLFLPQLQGERAPLWDPTLRAAFLGMGAGTTGGDLARAVYEGVALSARHVLGLLAQSAGVRPAHLTCGGGGFRADIWAEIRADILGLPMHRLAAEDPGLIGAAALAGLGVGRFADLGDAVAQLARIGRIFEPSVENRALYDDLFGLYVEAIHHQAPLIRRLTGISARQVG